MVEMWKVTAFLRFQNSNFPEKQNRSFISWVRHQLTVFTVSPLFHTVSHPRLGVAFNHSGDVGICGVVVIIPGLVKPDCLLYYLLYGSSCCWGVCERDVLVLQDFLDLLCFTAA